MLLEPEPDSYDTHGLIFVKIDSVLDLQIAIHVHI